MGSTQQRQSHSSGTINQFLCFQSCVSLNIVLAFEMTAGDGEPTSSQACSSNHEHPRLVTMLADSEGIFAEAESDLPAQARDKPEVSLWSGP
jgi:hypothetical protein